MLSLKVVLYGGLFTFITMVAFPQTPWQQYIALPSPENAEMVQTIGYDPPLAEKEQLERLFNDDLPMLENQVLAGDSKAIDLAFRLLKGSDGHLTEELLVMLGRIVRPCPVGYLQALSKNLAIGQIVYGSVSAIDESFVDRKEARKYEYQARIISLLSVKKRSLRKERDTCIAYLRDLQKGGA